MGPLIIRQLCQPAYHSCLKVRVQRDERVRPYPIKDVGQAVVDVLLSVNSSTVVILVLPAVVLHKEVFEGHHVLLLVGHHQLVVEAEHDELRTKRQARETVGRIGHNSGYAYICFKF